MESFKACLLVGREVLNEDWRKIVMIKVIKRKLLVFCVGKIDSKGNSCA